MNKTTFRSLNHLLTLRSEEKAQQTLYSFLDGDLKITDHLTHHELHLEASKIAYHLQAHCQKGDRAVLLFPPGLDYVRAYFGCLYAGVIAVPIFPPTMSRQVDRVMNIIQDARPTSQVFQQVKAIAPAWTEAPGSHWLQSDQLEEAQVKPYEASPSDIAFLQYTSGSTGAPKGVMISHQNLLENERMIRDGFGTDENTIAVNWLPLYHDMGLIGAVLHPLFLGGSSYLMSPFSFLKDPSLWLRAISTFRGSTCGGPNFAFDLCVRKVSEEVVDELDLSSWKQAFNGAEPIHAGTLENFENKFARAGFDPSSWRSCYGLAEATLMVSTATTDSSKKIIEVDEDALKKGKVREVSKGKALLSSGKPVQPQTIRIVEAESANICDPGLVGEIWISGPHVSQGYWEKEHLNQEVFHAQLEEEPGTTFFKTGDLGFLHEGELFIVGRLKDLIIIRGKNHYPQDIERTLSEAHEGLQPGGAAAFSIQKGSSEGLAVIAELSKTGKKFDGEDIMEAARRTIADVHELQVQAILLIPRRNLLKTSSGKVQRQANKKAFLEGKFKKVAQWEAQVDEGPDESGGREEKAEGLHDWLIHWMGSKLNLSPHKIDMEDPITAYGVDSLMLAEFETEVSEYMGRDWPVRDILLTEPSLRELVEKGEEFLKEEG